MVFISFGEFIGFLVCCCGCWLGSCSVIVGCIVMCLDLEV